MKSLGGGDVFEELATWHESLARLKAHESGALPTDENVSTFGRFMSVADMWYFLGLLESLLSAGLTTDAKSINEQFAGPRVRVDHRLIHLLEVLSNHVNEIGPLAPTEEVRKYILADLDHSRATEIMKAIAHLCQNALEYLRKTIGQECLPVFLKIRSASEENLNGVLNVLGENSSNISEGLHAQMLAKTVNIEAFYLDVTVARALHKYLTKLQQDMGIAGDLIFCDGLI